MKKLIITAIILTLTLTGNAFATDSAITVVSHENYLTGTGYVKVTLTANSATGGFIDVDNTIPHGKMKGIVEYATVEPGTVTPTANTDVSVWSSTGKSLFGDTGTVKVPSNDGQLADIDFSVTNETLNVKRPTHGGTTIQVRNNSVNSAKIILHIYYSTEGFSGIAEPLDVTTSAFEVTIDDSTPIDVTLDEPIKTTPGDMAVATITSQAIPNGTGYTFTAVDMTNKKGVICLQLQLEGAGTVSVNYAMSNDESTYRLPADSDAEEYTGLTATGGYGSDGHYFLPLNNIKPGKSLQIGINEVSAGSAVTATAILMTQ